MMEHKPCPFCGSDEKIGVFMIDEEFGNVVCEYCGAVGPTTDSREEAWELWDARATPATATEAEADA